MLNFMAINQRNVRTVLDTILKYYISDLILSTERNRYFIDYLEKIRKSNK